MSEDSNDNKENKTIPRTFVSPAFLMEIDTGTYGLYRNIEMEIDGVREKIGNSIGPIGIFRKCQGDEKPDLETFDQLNHLPLKLKAIVE